MTLSRRGFGAGLAAFSAVAGGVGTAQAKAPLLLLNGRFEQGASVIGRTQPRATITVDGEVVGQASAGGIFVVGFDRDAKPQALIAVSTPDGASAEHHADIADGHWDVQKIDGLPQDQVTPEDPALLARIAAEGVRKTAGFASNIDADYFRDGFDLPVKATRISARFGGQRILNGTPERPHYGTDMAAPIGTEVHAPADGLISFAETGLHYEGGLVLIDHGQGLITAYLHMSKVIAQRGSMVRRGELIGLVGMEGRATGPHLCWRMKWRGRYCDPAQLVGVTAPATI
jgi:murein DD-endopeptidase MepM/ murein hydrolase activator NlpD